MGKINLKKAGKLLRKAGKGAAGATREVVRIAEAIVAVATVVEEVRQIVRVREAVRGRPAQPGAPDPCAPATGPGKHGTAGP